MLLDERYPPVADWRRQVEARRVQHPKVHERKDRGQRRIGFSATGTMRCCRTGSVKTTRKFHTLGPSKGDGGDQPEAGGDRARQIPGGPERRAHALRGGGRGASSPVDEPGDHLRQARRIVAQGIRRESRQVKTGDGPPRGEVPLAPRQPHPAASGRTRASRICAPRRSWTGSRKSALPGT